MAQLYRFGPFEIDVRAGELRKYGTRVRLQEQPLRVLTMLLARPGEAVLREEIQQALWPNQTMVEFDQGINAAVKRLRTALGDSAAKARYIETLARRGYRFIGALEPADLPPEPAPPDHEELEGRTIGHYRVLELLGRGGMGVVYRAEDLRLGRKVAIKLLDGPAREAAPGTLARFRREARAAAALSHPHICTIFAVEDFAGEPAIVMELLEGETLAECLGRGPLSLDQVRRLGAELASALDAGHCAGIVHRDFKPANIILTANGPKVLDFGLAKFACEGLLDPELAAMTKTGAILGTLHYLSPEQAQGKEVDTASDVFSFGAVLYEMSTGAKAFAGDNPASVIAAILERQPSRSALPASLEQVIGQCLEKDPSRRPTNLSEAFREIEIAPDGVEEIVITPPVPESRFPSRRVVLGLAGGAALLTAGWRAMQGLTLFRSPVSSGLIYPPEGFVWAGGIALSPEGSQLAAILVDQRRVRHLFVRSLTSSVERILPGTEGAAFPFWSPDSRRIGFFANGKLHSISASGGSIQFVAGAAGPIGASWGSDRKILFGTATDGRLSLVEGSGGSPSVVRGFGEVSIAAWPQFFPDGRRFLFSGWDRESGTAEVYLASLDSPTPRVLIQRASAAQFAPPDYLLYLRDGNLMAQRFDWVNARPMAEAVAVARNRTGATANTASNRVATFSASQNGVLAFRTGPTTNRQRLVWRGRDGRYLRSVGEPGSFMELFLSRDGKSAVVNLGSASGNLALVDFAANTISPITSERPLVYDGVWSPDSRTVAYQIYTPSRTRILALTVGETTPRVVLDDGSASYPDDWSPDGKWILAHKQAPKQDRKQVGGEWIAFLTSVDGKAKGRVVLKTKGPADQFQFSPDGRWLAYNSPESGRSEVYVTNYPAVNQVTRISDGGGCQPIWRADSKELFYLTMDGRLMSVEMQNESVQTVRPKELFRTRLRPYTGFAQYGSDAAGHQFLVIEPDPAAEPAEFSEPIHVVANWETQPRE